MTQKEICRSKIVFRKRKKAWDHSLRYFIRTGRYNTPYKCKVCLYFHLTSKKAQPTPSKEFINSFNEWFGSPILEHND